MEQEFSLAHLTALSLSPPDLIEIASRCSYAFVGLRCTPVTPGGVHYPLSTNRTLMAETLARIAATGVRVLDVEFARLDPNTDLDVLDRLLETGAELGARHVITQLYDLAPAAAVDAYGQFCDRVASYGLTADLEFVSWSEPSDLDAVAAIIGAASRPNAGLLVDALHFSRSESSVQSLAEAPRDWFHFAHICDAAPAASPSVAEMIHAARHTRLPPGDGTIDLKVILAALPHIPLAIEAPNDAFAERYGFEALIRRCIEQARHLLSTSTLAA